MKVETLINDIQERINSLVAQKKLSAHENSCLEQIKKEGKPSSNDLLSTYSFFSNILSYISPLSDNAKQTFAEFENFILDKIMELEIEIKGISGIVYPSQEVKNLAATIKLLKRLAKLDKKLNSDDQEILNSILKQVNLNDKVSIDDLLRQCRYHLSQLTTYEITHTVKLRKITDLENAKCWVNVLIYENINDSFELYAKGDRSEFLDEDTYKLLNKSVNGEDFEGFLIINNKDDIFYAVIFRLNEYFKIKNKEINPDSKPEKELSHFQKLRINSLTDFVLNLKQEIYIKIFIPTGDESLTVIQGLSSKKTKFEVLRERFTSEIENEVIKITQEDNENINKITIINNLIEPFTLFLTRPFTLRSQEAHNTLEKLEESLEVKPKKSLAAEIFTFNNITNAASILGLTLSCAGAGAWLGLIGAPVTFGASIVICSLVGAGIGLVIAGMSYGISEIVRCCFPFENEKNAKTLNQNNVRETNKEKDQPKPHESTADIISQAITNDPASKDQHEVQKTDSLVNLPISSKQQKPGKTCCSLLRCFCFVGHDYDSKPHNTQGNKAKALRQDPLVHQQPH